MKAKGYQSVPSRPAKQSAKGYSYKDRDLAGMSPEKAQNALQPTSAEPVNMHKRMAGCN